MIRAFIGVISPSGSNHLSHSNFLAYSSCMDCSIAPRKPRRLRKSGKRCHTGDHVQRQAPETSARPIARGALGDRRRIGALEGEGFRDEVKRRPDPHRRMVGEADQQPNADLRLGPCDDEGSDERQFERGVRWYPEAPTGNTGTSGLDKFEAGWPRLDRRRETRKGRRRDG